MQKMTEQEKFLNERDKLGHPSDECMQWCFERIMYLEGSVENIQGWIEGAFVDDEKNPQWKKLKQYLNSLNEIKEEAEHILKGVE